MDKIKAYEELLNRTLDSLRTGTFCGEERKEANKLFDDIRRTLSEPMVETNDSWISVEEKPPMHGACLAIDVNGNMSITRGWMHIEDKKGRQFYIDSDLASHYFDENGRGKKPEMRICIYENRMTHWRLLPEPPKEDEDNG